MVVKTKNNLIHFFLYRITMINSNLILGGNLFGYSISRDETLQLLDKAFELGNLEIDTAGVYSAGASETIIGDWTSSRGVNGLTRISTKLEIRPENVLTNSENDFEFQFEASLSRLNCQSLDSVLLHHSTENERTLESFLEFVKNKLDTGAIKYWGICNISPGDFRILLKAMISASFRTVIIQNYCNWAKRKSNYWQTFFELAHEAQVDLKAVSHGVYGRGTLLTRNLNEKSSQVFGRPRASLNNIVLQEREDLSIQNMLRVIQAKAPNEGNLLERFALSFISNQGSKAVVGVRSIDQLLSATASLRLPISLEITESILTAIHTELEDLHLALGDPDMGI